MAVDDITPYKRHVYTGVGDYEFPFKRYLTSEVKVTAVFADGTTSLLVKDVDYSVALATAPLEGGTVTIVADNNPTATNIEIEGNMPFTQEVDWENGGPLDQPLITRAFDKLTMLVQQLRAAIDGAIAVSAWSGTWATDTFYTPGSIVYAPSYVTPGIYFCLEGHVSGDLAVDLAAGKWRREVDLSDVIGAEPALGNPGTSGFVLSSTTAGVRSWIDKEDPLGSPAYDGMALVSTAAGVRSWGFPEPSADGSALLKVLGDLIHCDMIAKSGAHTIQIDAVKCRSNDNSTLLSRESGSLTILSGVNTTYFVFVVRLEADGSTIFKAYTTFEGAKNDALVVDGAWRFLTIVINDGSGNIRDFIQRREELTWTVPATMPVIAATITTSFSGYDLSSFLPVGFIEYCEYMFTAAGTGYVSLSYDLSTVFLTIPYSATDTNKTARFPVFTTVWGYGPQMKYTTVNCSVKVLSIKLRR